MMQFTSATRVLIFMVIGAEVLDIDVSGDLSL